MGWRDQKRVARNAVHDTMALPCWHIPFSPAPPALKRGRLHTIRVTPKNSAIGDLDSQGYAQIETDQLRLVFMRAEVDPKRNDVFIFAQDEAYRVQPERPFDDQTVTVKVVKLDQSDLVQLLATIVPALEFFPI